MDQGRDRCIDGSIDGSINGLMDKLMDQSMDGWMDGGIDRGAFYEGETDQSMGSVVRGWGRRTKRRNRSRKNSGT